jgi:site-specific DNA-methyltransferase (adenine-specific)
MYKNRKIKKLFLKETGLKPVVLELFGHPQSVDSSSNKNTHFSVVKNEEISHEFFSDFIYKKQDSLLIQGDVSEVLKKIPSNVFQTCVTSPPYWSLRNYLIAGQIGLEESLNEYIEKLVNIFTEVHRTLRPDGTLWLNIGDTYTSGNRGWRAPDKKNSKRAMSIRPPTPEGLKEKDLIGIPWRIALALQNAGWYLRSDIIWNKPNCQPESVKDRPTKSHEFLFLFSKEKNYFYEQNNVRGPNNRNLRTVWDINIQPTGYGHLAPYPMALIDPCIKLGTKSGDLILDPFMGSGTTGIVASSLNRRFVGVELNPKYIDVSKKRLKGIF